MSGDTIDKEKFGDPMLYHGDSNEDETIETKEKYTNGAQFFFSVVGFSVGLICIWRFPYVVMDNGGGAFLIPFVIFLALCGVPLFFLELFMGQYSGKSPSTVWSVNPLFGGVGIGMLCVSGIVCVYYNVVIAWSMYYVVHSFTSALPWQSCSDPSTNGTWWWANPETCRDEGIAVAANVSNTTNMTVTTPSDDFFHNYVLGISSDIEHMGMLKWDLVLSLAVAWLLVFLCLFQGAKVAGKIAYFTATAPYVFLTILCVVGVTREGAMEGLKYFLMPKFSELLKFNIWFAAAVQVFFTLGPCWGGLITLSSFNRFHHNFYRDAMLIPVLVLFTSVFGGIVVFSILGHLAHQNGVTVDKVVTSGPGLVFFVYPEAVKILPYPQIWSVCFFLMIGFLGIDSQFGMFETVLTGIQDSFPRLRRHKRKLAAIMVTIFFCLGLPFVTKGGMYLLKLVDFYVAAVSLMIIALCELFAMAWCYGTKRIVDDCETMLHRRIPTFWRYIWAYVTPALLLFILVFSCIELEPPTYRGVPYPQWAIMLGYSFAIVPVAPILFVAIARVVQSRGPIVKRLMRLIKPNSDWKPCIDEPTLAIVSHAYPSTSTAVPMGVLSSSSRNDASASDSSSSRSSMEEVMVGLVEQRQQQSSQ